MSVGTFLWLWWLVAGIVVCVAVVVFGDTPAVRAANLAILLIAIAALRDAWAKRMG